MLIDIKQVFFCVICWLYYLFLGVRKNILSGFICVVAPEHLNDIKSRKFVKAILVDNGSDLSITWG